MWSEILKVLPRVEPGELKKMENDLTKRFGNVAKKFGSGLKKAVLGGGILAVATGMITKLLNPLQEIQETIDRTLNRADTISTDAKEFGTTEGKLFKLQMLAKSFGVDENALAMMLTKFQTALAEARLPGAGETAVSAFTGIEDTADAFFKFAQSMKNAPKDVQVLAQQEVFGERLAGKGREFFQNDLDERLKVLGALGSEAYTPVIQKAGGISDLGEILAARTEMADFLAKSGKMTEDMVIQSDRSKQIMNERETQRLDSYKYIKETSNVMAQMQNKVEDGFNWVIKEIPGLFSMVQTSLNFLNEKLTQIITWLQTIAQSPFMRGITSGIRSLFK